MAVTCGTQVTGHMKVMRRGLSQLVLSLALATPIAAAIGTPSALACGGWSVVTTPNPGPGTNELLSAVAFSTSDAWSAGMVWRGGAGTPIVERWDGTAWRTRSSPSAGQVWSVGGSSDTDLWLVGDRFLDHWNGSTWTAFSIPLPHGGASPNLHAVVAFSATNAWAVGFYSKSALRRTLVLHWNGTAWRVVSSPNAGRRLNTYLFDASAASAADIWAVGSYANKTGLERTFIVHYNGTSWTKVPSPNLDPSTGQAVDNEFVAVGTRSSTDAWAVGRAGGNGLIERWTGAGWTTAYDPGLTGYYSDVATASNGEVWVTDASIAPGLILHWDGSAWAKRANPSSTGFLFDLTVISPTDVWGVGQQSSGTLAEHYC
jgi:hypothetical protein